MADTSTLVLEMPTAVKPRVGFVSLGCPKNLVDSEVMMGLLHHNGAQLTANAEDADILVVNTCSFIDAAKQESVNAILEMAKLKSTGRATKLIVAGCLVERYRDEIRAQIPEVDAVVGTGELEGILAAAGLSPAGHALDAGNPFNILPQSFEAAGTVLPDGLTAGDMAQPSVDAHVQRDLAVFDSGASVPVGETMVSRAASAMSQHSRPLTDVAVAPQLRIVQSLAETGTTHGAGALGHRGEHVGHVSHPDKPAGADGVAAARTENAGLSTSLRSGRDDSSAGLSTSLRSGRDDSTEVEGPEEQVLRVAEGDSGGGVSFRAEGNLRELQGRFSREAWDGATAALPEYLYSDATPRILATPRASAYIKIAEGCDHPCSFCIIPQLRGKFRSRRIGSIAAEAQNLIAQGVREITLIGQDTTCYGEDLGLSEGLAQLLDALAPLPGLKWLRFLYTYPNKVTTRLLETMARHENVAKYLDVPLQHASPAVLKAMKRGGSGEIFLKLIEKARAIVPGIVIRTSFIVGFPGETQADFDLLCDFVQAAKIDWMGVFSYSDEEGAKAFEYDAALKVPKRTIEARRRKLMKLQQKISAREKATWVGRELDLLVEGESEETDLLWEGRTLWHAPEIDGKVFINDFGPHEALVPGTFYRARVTESHEYDLVATILE